jgi:hypothetical protein
MRHALLTLGLLLATPALAQSVDELVRELAAAASLDDAMTGGDGDKSKTFRIYERLRDTASRAEIDGLLAHASPIVRGYAVRALAEREESVDWLALLKARSTDTAKVLTFSGCVQSEQLLGDAILEFARYRKLLTAEQSLDLAEFLVAQKSPLYAREWALRNLKFRDGFLHPLRELAKAGDGPAHVALARYGLQKDLPLLVAWLTRDEVFDDTNAFLAAQQHPDASLLTVLIGLEHKARAKLAERLGHRLREWFGALVAQQSPAAADFLLRFYQETTGAEQRRFVLDLLHEVLAASGQSTPGQSGVFAALRRLPPEKTK